MLDDELRHHRRLALIDRRLGSGDGLADVVLGTCQHRQQVHVGRAYLVFGKRKGGPVHLADLSAGAQETVIAIRVEPDALNGRACAGVSDL